MDADGAKAQCLAGDVDFAHDTFAQPAFLFVGPDACDVLYLADKFVARGAAKTVVAAENFDVCVTDASEMDTNERPAGPQFWNGLAGSEKLAVAYDEGEQGNLLFGFFRKSATRRRCHAFEQFEFGFETDETPVQFDLRG